MKKNFLLLLSMFTMFALTFTACSDDDDETKTVKVAQEVTIESVNFGTTINMVTSEIESDYAEAFAINSIFNTKEQVLKVTDAIYDKHKAVYDKEITSGKVVIYVDDAVAKTYDYSFAKATEVVAGEDFPTTKWICVARSTDNGATWKDMDADDDYMHAYLFSTGKYYTNIDKQEPKVENIDFNLKNYNVLTIKKGNETTVYDIVEYSSTLLTLRNQENGNCYRYRPEVTVKSTFEMNEALSKLLKTKKLSYFNQLNKVAVYDMAQSDTFNLDQAHQFFPVRASFGFDYTIDESAYTEGETVTLAYDYSIILVQGPKEKQLEKSSKYVEGKECSSLAEIKEFISNMSTELNDNSGFLVTRENWAVPHAFSELK